MENNRYIVVRRVHLQGLIDSLLPLWQQGLEYVDLVGQLSLTQDTLQLMFTKEYMHPDLVDNYDDIESDNENNIEENDNNEIKSRKLSDEDLNQLT